MESLPLIQIITLLLGFYMAWNIGANDVANAMGTSVGSKALTLKKAVFLAAILEFSGSYFVGSSVSETIQRGIINPSIFQNDPMIFIYGMMGSLLATGALLQLASYFGLPISTTHAIVGAVFGFGLCIGGVDAVYWTELGWIASSWVISPLLSGCLSYAIFYLIQRKILFALDPIGATQRLAPFFIFLCFAVATMSFVYHGLSCDFSFATLFSLSCLVGLLAALLSRPFLLKITEPALQSNHGFHSYQTVSLEKALHHLQRVHLSNRNPSYASEISEIVTQVEKLTDTVKKTTPELYSTHLQYHGVEKIFIGLQILSACLVAFAHGANDVANAIGPVAAVLSVAKHKILNVQSEVPSWLLALGGGGIIIGLASWGWRVIETIGKKITELTPTRGFSAEFGAATTILLASKLGLPISTTHALIGAVLGVGLAGGLKALNLQTIKEIFVSWIVTIPLCALFSILAFYLIRFCFS
jgi:phosphate/sulfate permease